MFPMNQNKNENLLTTAVNTDDANNLKSKSQIKVNEKANQIIRKNQM